MIWALLSAEPDWEKLRGLFDEFVPNDLLREAINKMEKLQEGHDKDKDAKRYVEELHEINKELSDNWRALAGTCAQLMVRT